MQKTKRTKQILLMLVLLCVTWPLLAFAGEVDLPKTGQTTCYDANGDVIPCPGTGQDGDSQAGVDWPEPRFVDNGNGTVTDNLTGLIWLKNAGCAGTMTWNNAVTYCNNLANGSCGLTDGSVAGDWRLPNIVELESLVNAEGNSYVWLNSQGFTNVQPSYYWSATSGTYGTDGAWIVYMNYGGVVYDGSKAYNGYYVWPVRAGQSGSLGDSTISCKTWQTGQKTSYAAGDDGDLERGVAWPSPRFVDNGNGTVTDHLTGLIWLKNAKCAGYMPWNNALSFCSNLSSGSYGLSDGSGSGDWRLPNRKELLSLIDYSRCNPALPQGHPFTNVQLYLYWSATTNGAYNTRSAWGVHMLDGYVGSYNKPCKFYVWPVRAGQSGSLGNLTISYPNGGETLTKGNDYTITWNSTNITGTIQIDLYKGGTASGNKILEIASAAENNGSYIFNPPVSLTDGTDYYIGISAESGTVTDFSDAAFSIATMSLGDLTITYPNGGEKMTKGNGYTITWSSTDVTGTVEIDLYKGGIEPGNMVMQIAAGAENDGQYTFNPATSIEDGDDYYIGISAEDGAVSDFSDSAFSIASVPDPGCVSQKLKTASTLCTALMNCWVKEIKDVTEKYEVKNYTGVAIQKFVTGWGKAQDKAENKGLDCDAGSSEEIGAIINDALEDIYKEISSHTDQGNKDSITLGSALLKATGKKCSSLLKAQSAYLKDKTAKKDVKLSAAIAKADMAFANSFNKAKAKAIKKGLSCDDSIKTYLESAIDDLESNILSCMGIELP